MSVPRHLTSKDCLPPNVLGKVRLYYMQYCPYALRAKLLLTMKGVDFEIVNINLLDKPAWFLELRKAATVPVMEIDGKVIGESLVIAEYIDEVYSKPGERTIPMDPYERAKMRMLLADQIPKAVSAIYDRLYERENWQDTFYKHVGALDEILSASKFFAGEEFGYADYMIWPWLRYLNPYSIHDVLPTGKLPNIERWIQVAKEDDTILKCHTDFDILGKFTACYPKRNWKYDFETKLE